MEQALLIPETAPDLPTYPTLKESWTALGWCLLITLLAGLVVVLPISATGHFVGEVKLTLEFLLGAVGILLTIWWLRRRAGPRRWLGLRKWPRPVHWQVYALVALLVVAQAVLLSGLVFLHLPNWYSANFQDLASHPLLALCFGCLAAPVCEELFFRGVLLQGLLHNYRPAVAIIQSALLFGLLHLNPEQSVGAFFIGLLIGWVYYCTRSLLLCIYMHALNNLLAFSTM